MRTGTPIKEVRLQRLSELPVDNSYEEILREFALALMIERDLADSEAVRPADRLMGKVRWTSKAESWAAT